jgi:ADP-ribose pyrophosphatase YjhB (NUDIX family)
VSRIERCAGAIVFDGAGRLLMVRRGTEPGIGMWTLPGGRCEEGESTEQACVREVAEETGLEVAVESRVARVTRAGTTGVTYDITDFVCSLTGGTLRPGDDADEARWVTRVQLRELAVVPGVLDFLVEHDLVPA